MPDKLLPWPMDIIPAGFFKDALNPTDEEIVRWAAIEGAHYPPEMEQDWDLCIANRGREELFLRLAADKECPNRLFFLSCLYLMVGSAIRSSGGTWPLTEVSRWISSINAGNSAELVLFVARSKELLEKPESFDYDKWCSGGHAFGIDYAALTDRPHPPRRWWEFWKH